MLLQIKEDTMKTAINALTIERRTGDANEIIDSIKEDNYLTKEDVFLILSALNASIMILSKHKNQDVEQLVVKVLMEDVKEKVERILKHENE